MAQPHKGPRVLVACMLPTVVRDDLQDERSRLGISSDGQLAADLLAHVTGHPDLARELSADRWSGPQALDELEQAISRTRAITSMTRTKVMIRPPADAYNDLKAAAVRLGVAPSGLIADVLTASLGRPRLVQYLGRREKELLLAI